MPTKLVPVTKCICVQTYERTFLEIRQDFKTETTKFSNKTLKSNCGWNHHAINQCYKHECGKIQIQPSHGIALRDIF